MFRLVQQPGDRLTIAPGSRRQCRSFLRFQVMQSQLVAEVLEVGRHHPAAATHFEVQVPQSGGMFGEAALSCFSKERWLAHPLAASPSEQYRTEYQLQGEWTKRIAEQQADGERMRQAIGRLGHDQRQVILLRFVDDLDYREVAQIVGKSVAAVRVIQHRALGNLRKIVRAESVG